MYLPFNMFKSFENTLTKDIQNILGEDYFKHVLTTEITASGIALTYGWYTILFNILMYTYFR